jgi:iron complex outermembrane receptor protein
MTEAQRQGFLKSASSAIAIATYAICLQSIGGQAHAQAMPASSPASMPTDALEVVVVTAQKREQNVQKVPVAVTVVSSSDLERLQVNNIEALQYSTPSLVVTGGDPTRKRFGIRGIADQSRNPGVENRIGVYVDGVWVGRSTASNQGVLDLQSIEILRGPQGTLFGKNTVAGAINITTVRPKEGYSGYIEGEVGNYNQRQIKAMANLGFNDVVAARISGTRTLRDGFTKNIFNNLDNDNRDDYGLRGQFQVKTDDLRVYIAADMTRMTPRLSAGGERAPDPLAPLPRQISHNLEQKFLIEYSGASAQVDHDFDNGGALTSITAYRSGQYIGGGDEDYSPQNIAATREDSGEQTEHFSQEVRYASDSNGKFDYLAGLYYLAQRVEAKSGAFVFAPAVNPRAPAVFLRVDQNSRVDTEMLAGFVHANYRPTEKSEITFGARLTQEEKTISYRIVDQSGLFTNGTLNDSRSTTDFAPTISANYKITDTVMAYGRYARGFKSGGWNADFVSSIPDMDYDDESVDSYELGLKTTFFDRRLQVNLATYISKHRDYQVFSFVQLANGGTALNVSNAGRLTSEGFEIEVEARPTNWLNLFANYGYNDAIFDSFKNGGGPGVNFDGNRAADAPKHNFNFGFATDFDIGFAALVLQGDYNYRSSFFGNPDNLPVNLGQTLEQINLRAGLEFERVTAFAWVRNAADVTEVINSGRSFLGFPRVEFNDPQTYGLTVKVKL